MPIILEYINVATQHVVHLKLHIMSNIFQYTKVKQIKGKQRESGINIDFFSLERII